MAHHDEQSTSAIEQVLEILCEHGLGAMAQAMQTLMNEAMKLERSEFLGAAPGERSHERLVTRTASRTRRCAAAWASWPCGFRRCDPCPVGIRSPSIRSPWSAACAANGP